MESFAIDSELMFEGQMVHANFTLESAILTYTENLYNDHYVTEATRDSLWTALKKFFATFILSIKSFIDELTIKIDHVVKEKRINQRLNEIQKELKEKENSGQLYVDMVDYMEMKKVLLKYRNDLFSYAKKFAKVKYTKTYQVEDDLKAFNDLIDKCDSELDRASSKQKRVPIREALNFVEDEIRGKSEVIKSLNDSVTEFKELQRYAQDLESRMNIVGAEVIPKHVGLIRRMVNAIGSFLRKWTIKFIMGVVFVFAF